MQRISRVGFDVDVVAEGTVRAVEEFDDAKPLIDRIEQGPVALFAVSKRGFGALQLAIVCDRKRLEPGILGFERCNPAMQLFDVDCHGNPPGGNRGNGGRMGNNIGTLAVLSSAGTESSRFQRTVPGKSRQQRLAGPTPPGPPTGSG